MNEITFVSIFSLFAAGLLSFFSPCVFPLLPVYISILTDRKAPLQVSSGDGITTEATLTAPADGSSFLGTLVRPLLFIAGLAVAFILLGFGAGSLGAWINNRLVTLIGGAIVVLFGLFQMELIAIPWLQQTHKINADGKTDNSWFRPFLLGVTFSFGWTPCIGPLLASALFMASQGDTALTGGLLMAVYTLGLAIPFLVISLFAETVLRHYRKLNRYLPLVKKIGGALLVLMGILLMSGKFSSFFYF